jgi:hypothetical protein
LDPDGKSFWSADFVTNNFYHFEISSGDILGGPFPSLGSFVGVCLLGEVTGVKRQPCGVFDMSIFCPFIYSVVLLAVYLVFATVDI